MYEENIVAVSTPMLSSGVSVIRISGDSPLDIAAKMFSSKTSVYDFEPYKLYVGTINAESFKDFGMCVYFKGPRSYTGEDMIEFHCHGGIAIVKGILDACLKCGARLAERGEFTKRAFLNGKLSLSSCEGLISMINSESLAEVKSGYYLYKERLFGKIKTCQDALTFTLASIDANIDYPEEGIEETKLDQIMADLKKVRGDLQSLADTFSLGEKTKTGVKVAICGKPNAGKSSILNAILNCEKAIVTSIEGTTRDIVEGSREINGVKFDFMDTAGIRESDDVVEKIGIERSIKAIECADVVLFVLDGDSGFTDVDREIYQKIQNTNLITVINKCDLNPVHDIKGDLVISAKTGQGVDALINLIYTKSGLDTLNLDGDYLVEKRHLTAIQGAVSDLEKAISALYVMPLDIITVDIRSALVNLGLISGETADENVINEIFSKFCVGK